MDLVELDRRALEWTADLLGKAAPDQWDAPTPCSDWNLRQLVEHMVVQNEGFAVAPTGGAPKADHWTPHPIGDDPRAALVISGGLVTAAYSAPGVQERKVYLAELGRTVPGRIALSFHFVDYLAHGWDVARALGLPDEPDPELTAAGLPIAEMVPDEPPSRGPGASFAHRVPVADGTPPHQRLVALLGRSPAWTP